MVVTLQFLVNALSGNLIVTYKGPSHGGDSAVPPAAHPEVLPGQLGVNVSPDGPVSASDLGLLSPISAEVLQ